MLRRPDAVDCLRQLRYGDPDLQQERFLAEQRNVCGSGRLRCEHDGVVQRVRHGDVHEELRLGRLLVRVGTDLRAGRHVPQRLQHADVQ